MSRAAHSATATLPKEPASSACTAEVSNSLPEDRSPTIFEKYEWAESCLYRLVDDSRAWINYKYDGSDPELESARHKLRTLSKAAGNAGLRVKRFSPGSSEHLEALKTIVDSLPVLASCAETISASERCVNPSQAVSAWATLKGMGRPWSDKEALRSVLKWEGASLQSRDYRVYQLENELAKSKDELAELKYWDQRLTLDDLLGTICRAKTVVGSALESALSFLGSRILPAWSYFDGAPKHDSTDGTTPMQSTSSEQKGNKSENSVTADAIERQGATDTRLSMNSVDGLDEGPSGLSEADAGAQAQNDPM